MGIIPKSNLHSLNDSTETKILPLTSVTFIVNF